MKTWNISLIVLLVAGLCILSYYAGFRNGSGHKVSVDDLHFLITAHDATYRAAESGDLKKVQSTIGMILLGEVRVYQQKFRDDTNMTKNFVRHLADAKLVADKVQASLVPLNSILTNIPRTPDASIQVTKPTK